MIYIYDIFISIYTDIRILAEPIFIEKGFNSIAFLEPIWHDAALALEGSPQKKSESGNACSNTSSYC